MSIESRIARIEAHCRPDATRYDGAAVRDAILELLKPENATTIDAIRASAVADDCDLTLRSLADVAECALQQHA